MAYRYTPILRWKRGERTGLGNTHTSKHYDVTPIFVILANQYKDKDPTKSRPKVTASDNFVLELIKIWGNKPCYVDASAVPRTALNPHPLVDIATSARNKGANIMPAIKLSDPMSYQQDVVRVCQTDQKGVALCVDLPGLTSAQSWMGAWPIPINETDLIASFGTTVGMVHQLGAPAIQAFQNLPNGAQWRSVTICGTSMPDNFSGYPAGLHPIPRKEWSLWHNLSTSGLPYRIDYGDHATVPLNAPPPGISWGFPINVRYTLSDEFLICRGVSPTGYGGIDMSVQLIGHAQSIQNYARRNSIVTCWGDNLIDDIASRITVPGSLERWVQIGICRHIERVRTDLP